MPYHTSAKSSYVVVQICAFSGLFRNFPSQALTFLVLVHATVI